MLVNWVFVVRLWVTIDRTVWEVDLTTEYLSVFYIFTIYMRNLVDNWSGRNIACYNKQGKIYPTYSSYWSGKILEVISKSGSFFVKLYEPCEGTSEFPAIRPIIYFQKFPSAFCLAWSGFIAHPCHSPLALWKPKLSSGSAVVIGPSNIPPCILINFSWQSPVLRRDTWKLV